jgi:Fe-S-cluster-containing dehydrogenase component/DMSO reductase anchor subunit
MVACYVENNTKPPQSWRQVNHYNKEKLPLLGFIHLSLACNHCGDAPCLKACPSGAFTIDLETSAVIHNPELCIGCKYCTWACPFDAPKYNNERGIIEKCNFCYHRIKEGEIPACALNCPTGALSFGEIPDVSNPNAVGLSSQPIFPKISVKGEEVHNSVPMHDLNASGSNEIDIKRFHKSKNEHTISPMHEWPIAVFTFIGALLNGWIWATIIPKSIEINFWTFGFLGAIGIVLSAMHLGKPLKSYLSILNIKTSWLSREILLFGLFIFLGFLGLLLQSTVILIIASLIGLGFLVSVEMVYSLTKKKYSTPIHSSNTISIALTFGALFSQYWSVLIVLLALKTMLFAVRHGSKQYSYHPYIAFIAFFRLILGFLIPFGFLAFTEITFTWILAGSIILGEAIDRFMYYGDFEPERPFSYVNRKK